MKTLYFICFLIFVKSLMLSGGLRAQSLDEETPKNPMRLVLGGSFIRDNETVAYYHMYGFANHIPLTDEKSVNWFSGLNVQFRMYHNATGSVNENYDEDKRPSMYGTGTLTLQSKFALGKNPDSHELLLDIGPELRIYALNNTRVQLGCAARAEAALRNNKSFLFFSSLDYGLAFSTRPLIKNRNTMTNFGIVEIFIRVPLF